MKGGGGGFLRDHGHANDRSRQLLNDKCVHRIEEPCTFNHSNSHQGRRLTM